MKLYKEYKDSGVEWIGMIPIEWGVVKLKYLVKHSTEKGNGNTRLKISLSNIESGSGRLIRGDSQEFEGQLKKFKKNDVLFNKLRPYLAKVLLAEENGECVSELLVFTANENKIDPMFLFYRLISEQFVSVVDGSTYGAKMPRASVEFILNLELAVPSMNEQKSIAKFVDYHTTLIDALINKKEQLRDKLKEQRQACINQAVTKGLDTSVKMKDSGITWLGEIPEHWKIAKMKFLTRKIVDGTHFTPTYVDSGVPFLRVTDIQQKEIDLSKVKFIPVSEHLELSKRCKAERGDILLSKNGTIGIIKVVDWDWEFSLFVSLCLIKLNEKLESSYFSYFFSSSIVDKQVKIGSKTTSVTNLHLDKIKELLIAFPKSNLEQIEISNYLDKKMLEIDHLIFEIEDSIKILKDYRQSLISEAVNGKINVCNWQARMNN